MVKTQLVRVLVDSDTVEWLDKGDIKSAIDRYYGDKQDFIRHYLLDNQYVRSSIPKDATSNVREGLMMDIIADEVSTIIDLSIDSENLAEAEQVAFYSNEGPRMASLLHQAFDRLHHVLDHELDIGRHLATDDELYCDVDVLPGVLPNTLEIAINTIHSEEPNGGATNHIRHDPYRV